MTTQPEVVRQNELINQLVLDRGTLEELGRVEVLWMYPPAHRVLGFICKSGFLGGKKAAFQLAQIHAIGANGILTQGQPEATDAEKVRRLESLIHQEVWSDEGNKIGKITDCLFNLKTGEITYYLFVSNGWSGITGEVYQLSPTQILGVGRKRVMVPEGILSSFAIYREGIPQKLSKARSLITTEATQEWRSIAQRAETTAEQAKGRLQHLADQAKTQAQALSQRTRETAQTLNERLQEETQGLVEQAKEKGQVLAEQMKEGTQILGKQVEEGIQTLTVHAEEIIDSVTEEASKSAAPATPTEPIASKASDEWDDDDEPWNDEFWTVPEPVKAPTTPPTDQAASPVSPTPVASTPVAQNSVGHAPVSQTPASQTPASQTETNDEWDDEDEEFWSTDDPAKVPPNVPPAATPGYASQPRTPDPLEEEDEPWI